MMLKLNENSTITLQLKMATSLPVFFFFFFFLMDKKKCVCVCVCVWQKKSTPENGGHIQWAQRDKTIQEKQKTTFSSTNSIKDIEPSFM